LDVERDDSIKFLSKKLEDILGIPCEDQQLYFGTQSLQSLETAEISLDELNIKQESTLHLSSPLKGGFVRRFYKDIKQLFPPWVGFSFWFVPCALNFYGIWKFRHLGFYSNKDVLGANKFTGEPIVGGGGH